MPKIINVLKEHQPAVRFVGKRYTDADRADGGFGHKWGEWFQNAWFELLEQIGEAKGIEHGYMGLMRCCPDFEYWIGMCLPTGTDVPDGFEYMDLAEGDIGVCWIQAKEGDASIYGMHDQCIEKFRENGMDKYRVDDRGRAFFFERYNSPRFTDRDEQGNIILDYGIYLA